MNETETRLRDAYRSAAQTVSPDTIRGLGEQSVTIRLASQRTTRPARRRIFTPVAAGAAVALIGILTAVIVPGVLASSQRPGHPQAVSPATRYAVALNLAGRERFLIIRDVATGARVASVAAPAHGFYFSRVATGDGRNYVAVVMRAATCRSWLYRFRLNGAGQPTALAPLRPVFNGEFFAKFAVSADGRTLAFLGEHCAGGSASASEFISVLHLETMRTTFWGVPSQVGANVTAVSLTADGSMVAYDVAPVRGPDSGVYVLPASAAPGPALQRSRAVLRPAQFGSSQWINSAVITPDGRTIYFTTAGRLSYRDGTPTGYRWQLRAVSVATGQSQLVRSYSRGYPEALSADPAVGQALVQIQRPPSAGAQQASVPTPSPSPTRSPKPSPSPSPTRSPRPSPSPTRSRTPGPYPTPSPSPYRPQPRQVVLLINLATGARTILNPAIWNTAADVYAW